jgi:DNA-binding response OmpR family regulator
MMMLARRHPMISSGTGNSYVLVVEDDAAFGLLLEAYLQTSGFRTVLASSGRQLFIRLDTYPVGVIVLDLTLPDEDGLALTRRIRARSDIPIIITTGRQGADDRLAGFELGADDYLTKPFDPRELVVRVRRRLNATALKSTPVPASFLLGGWLIDTGRRVVRRDRIIANVTPREFEILLALVRAGGRAMTRAQLLDLVLRGEEPESERSVDIVVSRLRRKLEKDPRKPKMIITVQGYGYRINEDLLSAENQ